MPNRPQKTLLVLDRDGANGREVSSILSMLGHAADHAADEATAIALLEKFRYSVLLLDLAVLRGGGPELEAHLRDIPGNLAPVVIVLAEPGEEIGECLEPHRIHGIMRRPIDAGELAAIALTCSELTGNRSLEAMCLAVLAGTPLLAMLSGKL